MEGHIQNTNYQFKSLWNLNCSVKCFWKFISYPYDFLSIWYSERMCSYGVLLLGVMLHEIINTSRGIVAVFFPKRSCHLKAHRIINKDASASSDALNNFRDKLLTIHPSLAIACQKLCCSISVRGKCWRTEKLSP